jgi:hypothetical protein
MSSIADSLAPEVLAQLGSAFRLELEEIEFDRSTESTFISDEYLERHHGMVTSEHLWDTAWRFGIVVDDDLSYYVPNDYDSELQLTSVDNPPPVLSVAEQERAA